ncbi:hepcidin [Ornithorhynchus anatinus]|uniref:hepcidin n=1 Tax=Ornithorhynchus anatinus TaxID=9258 RepID=UPI0010A891AE|nr:hepcidin [Ornithorhynchus anatinus]
MAQPTRPFAHGRPFLLFLLFLLLLLPLCSGFAPTSSEQAQETADRPAPISETPGVPQDFMPQARLQRTRRHNSHFPICSFCCGCCRNRDCGFCCRT